MIYKIKALMFNSPCLFVFFFQLFFIVLLNVSIVLNFKTILYGYENNEIVKNNQLYKFFIRIH